MGNNHITDVPALDVKSIDDLLKLRETTLRDQALLKAFTRFFDTALYKGLLVEACEVRFLSPDHPTLASWDEDTRNIRNILKTKTGRVFGERDDEAVKQRFSLLLDALYQRYFRPTAKRIQERLTVLDSKPQSSKVQAERQYLTALQKSIDLQSSNLQRNVDNNGHPLGYQRALKELCDDCAMLDLYRGTTDKQRILDFFRLAPPEQRSQFQRVWKIAALWLTAKEVKAAFGSHDIDDIGDYAPLSCLIIFELNGQSVMPIAKIALTG